MKQDLAPETSAPPRAFVSWSSGKDSAFALQVVRGAGEVEVAGLLTTITSEYERVAMHGVRNALLEMQAERLGLPLLTVALPTPCPNAEYETRMAAACARLREQGVHHIVFGDLFLADLRDYRERNLAAAGMRAVFPLWQRDTRQLAQDMLDSGLVAYLTCVDPRRLAPDFAGRRFDAQLLRDLPADVDPCGENGEFHTVVTGGPMFSEEIEVHVGARVERDGFVFADVIPES